MNINSTTTNYFRTTAQTGLRQKVERQKPLDLPGGILLWQTVGKVLLWSLPVVLGVNLWCASAIDSHRTKAADMAQAVQQLNQQQAEMEVQMNRLLSPVRVRITAAEKLGLYKPTPEQIEQM